MSVLKIKILTSNKYNLNHIFLYEIFIVLGYIYREGKFE